LYASDPDWMDVSGFGEQFPAGEQALRAWREAGASAEDITAALSEGYGDSDEADSLRADGIAFSLVDLDVFGPILDGSIVAGFDADVPIPVPGVLLDLSAGCWGSSSVTCSLQASNSTTDIVASRAGHLMHGTVAHRRAYLEHLRRFLAT
jgi:hypothetical protein